MHLLVDVAAGLDSAASGHVQIKARGTAQDADAYSDAEGLNQLSGTQHTLGSEGSRNIYVDQQVDIYWYDSNGSLIRGPYTHVAVAQNVEYTGASFTGTDPTSGATGVSKPVNLSTVLDLWKTSSGTIDFSVQKDVAATPATWTLKRLGVTVGTAWFNVKDPTYGAKGDGTTNDAAAFQAAIDAAEAAGGGVILVPPGTYNVGSALTLDDPGSTGVIIQGIGMPIIQTTSTTANIFTITASLNAQIRDVRLEVAAAAAANNTGYAISVNGDGLLLENVYVSSVSATYQFARAVSATASSDLTILGGYYKGLTGIFVTATAQADGTIYIANAKAYSTGGSGVAVDIDDVTDVFLIGVLASATGASSTALDLSDVLRCKIAGCHLDGLTNDLKVDANSQYVIESGSFYEAVSATAGANSADNRWEARHMGAGTTSVAGGAMTFANAGFHSSYEYTGTADVTSIVTTGLPPDSRYTLRFTGTAAATGMTDGSNLLLAGNFGYTPNDIMEFHFDGTNFWEAGRSAN